MSFYEKKILPKVLDLLCGSSPINYQRKKIVPKVSGNVLEIGIGSGLNLPHYNVSNISNITALDPAEELTDIAKKRISELDLKSSEDKIVESFENFLRIKFLDIKNDKQNE